MRILVEVVSAVLCSLCWSNVLAHSLNDSTTLLHTSSTEHNNGNTTDMRSSINLSISAKESVTDLKHSMDYNISRNDSSTLELHANSSNSTSIIPSNSIDLEEQRKIEPSYLIQSKDIHMSGRTKPFPTINRKPSSLKPDNFVSVTESPSEYDSSSTSTTISTFLSFDEWRKIKLDKESSILKDKESKSLKTRDPIQLPMNEKPGDEEEIDLGFLTSPDTKDSSPDTEGKVYKDKFNFASFDCAATIVKSNSEASGANAILFENKDTYLLNPCSAANKFVVVELCQDILVEEVVLANFEFFSSTFRKIKIYVSDTFPAKNGWKNLGEFEAQNTRNIQKFIIENPQIWARYLKVEILTHYDNEFYCPISLLRAHGKNMMDELKMSNDKENEEKKKVVENKVNIELAKKQEEENNKKKCESNNSDKRNCKSDVSSFEVPSILNESDTNFPNSSCHRIGTLNFQSFLTKYNLDNTFNEKTCESNITMRYPQTTVSNTEESVFQNILKRLTMLQKNSTLTALYIEEQSQLIFEAFDRLEQSYSIKIDDIIKEFNLTMVNDLNSLKIFATDLKDLSVRLLEEQKLANIQSILMNNSKMEELTSELASTKRLTLVMMLVLTALIIYLVLAKDSEWDEVKVEDAWLQSNFLKSNNKKFERPKNLIKNISDDLMEQDATSMTSSLYEKSTPDNGSLPELRERRSPKYWTLNNLSDTDIDDITGISSGMEKYHTHT